MPAVEINFDGIPGPTHNYGGLSPGNLASMAHANRVSNPRKAALEGLAKMKFLADLGVPQAVLPPHERPDVHAMRRLGFFGDDGKVLQSAAKHPWLLTACGSASAMWAANAATISPSADSADGRVHITPANLTSQFHRSLEPTTTARVLKKIFRPEAGFVHHDPLPAAAAFSDEGAANHFRLTPSHGEPGLQIFVFGRDSDASDSNTLRFPARQTAEASRAIARLHQLGPQGAVFFRQNPDAISAGAFHNDVVCVGNENVLLYHQRAFAEDIRGAISKWFAEKPAHLIEVPEADVPLGDAVASYLFNSQIVTLTDGTMALIAPAESREIASTRLFLGKLLAQQPVIRQIHFVDVRQSMNNGGGPACLRLRVVLTPQEHTAINQAVLLSDSLHDTLKAWIERHYRDRLSPGDLADANLLDESRTALDELTQILGLGSIYPFQIEA